MSAIVDFTKMRLHTRTRGTATIEKCPKCGRKGAQGEFKPAKDGRRRFHYIHAGKVVSAAGIPFFEITDGCFYTQEPEPTKDVEETAVSA